MLKRFLIFLTVCGIVYSCYFDWKVGTLPARASDDAVPVHADNISEIPSVEVTVLNGDTVLSIVEKLNDGTLPTSMSQVINDFESLNPNVKAHVIKSGSKYLFPIYKKVE
ncbi:hypothetical protein CIB95_04870 [Lottiidibacillus patelloidae]|uniref:LysM domain-containing protein n=1 Tax=Lottiidibacillus patelloidae TaxID=2670334 RepID=A0A263BVC7_9BACI|nr:hypothetical protein [Lottiidibacillus patelloidae]OZM57701.1 hypothetical protein CIB95_04870 [Lottiidibacillus patelloidae]